MLSYAIRVSNYYNFVSRIHAQGISIKKQRNSIKWWNNCLVLSNGYQLIQSSLFDSGANGLKTIYIYESAVLGISHLIYSSFQPARLFCHAWSHRNKASSWSNAFVWGLRQWKHFHNWLRAKSRNRINYSIIVYWCFNGIMCNQF